MHKSSLRHNEFFMVLCVTKTFANGFSYLPISDQLLLEQKRLKWKNGY